MFHPKFTSRTSGVPLGLWGSLPTWTHLPLGRPANNWKNCGSSPKTLGYQITFQLLPSGKHTKNYGKSPFRMGKFTISTGPFSSSQTVTNDQRVIWFILYTNVILHLRPDHSIQVLKKHVNQKDKRLGTCLLAAGFDVSNFSHSEL